MKAAVVSRFGKDWAVAPAEVAKPVPSAGEVLIRVRAATVNRTDYGELRHPIGNRIITRAWAQRRTLGMDFAGEIQAVGTGVKDFKIGDRVFGMCPLRENGAQAEYLCMDAKGRLEPIPAATRFDE